MRWEPPTSGEEDPEPPHPPPPEPPRSDEEDHEPPPPPPPPPPPEPREAAGPWDQIITDLGKFILDPHTLSIGCHCRRHTGCGINKVGHKQPIGYFMAWLDTKFNDRDSHMEPGSIECVLFPLRGGRQAARVSRMIRNTCVFSIGSCQKTERSQRSCGDGCFQFKLVGVVTGVGSQYFCQ